VAWIRLEKQDSLGAFRKEAFSPETAKQLRHGL